MSMETLVFFWIVWAIIAVLIGNKKNISLVTSLALGCLLGLIGIVILLFMPTELPKAPKGMYATKCQRCTAVQNLPTGQAEFTCWQCKTAQHVANWAWS
jgi:hypothetical protein